MANDLKKVGLVFKEDGAVDFIKTINSVNVSLRENYSDFKLVQAQWDESTKSSQKLSDKLVYLNNAYDIQSSKVTALRKELEEFESAEIRDETAIQKKRTALTQAETSLQNYQNQMDSTSKKIQSGTTDLEDYTDKLDKAGNKLTDVGKKASVFSVAFAAALGLSVKSAIDFESSFAGVEKTVDATDEQLSQLKEGIKDMAKAIPATTTEISSIAEAAGQLGIKTDAILSFTEVMIGLGEATNLSSSEAADALARFANITGMAQSDFDRLASTIVDLGNNGASTEKDITEMALRLAGAGKTVGMTEANIVSFASALSSVGIEAEMGGSAFSKMMINIEAAVAQNSPILEKYAELSGMTAKQFSEAWENDAAGVMTTFLEGLGNVEKNGGNLITTLGDMGIEEVRLRDTILRAANASDLFSESIKTGNEAWKENNALQTEVEKRYATTESQIAIMKNTLNDMAMEFGELLLPSLLKMVESLKNVFEWVNSLSPVMKTFILILGTIVAVIGPLLIVIGKMATGVSALIKIFTVLGPVFTAIKAAVLAFTGALSAPILIIAAIGIAVAGLVYLVIKYWDQIKEVTVNIFSSIKEFFQNLWDSITGIISNFVNTIVSVLSVPFDFLKNMFLLIVALLAMAIESYWNFISPFIEAIISVFKTVWDGICAGLSFIKDVFVNVFTFIKDNVISPIVNFYKNIFDTIWSIIETAINKMKNGFDTMASAIKDLFFGIKDTISNVFSAIANIIKVPINAVIGSINSVFRSLNKVKIPDWVPEIGGQGINFKMIDFLAKGGTLVEGSAVVAEAGPELLMQQGNRTTVLPLSNGGGATKTELIDYTKLFTAFLKALNSCKIKIDKDGLIRIIDDRLLEVV